MNNLGILIMRKQTGVLLKIGIWLGVAGVGLLFYSSITGQWIMKGNGEVWSWKVDLMNALSSIAGYLYFRSIEKLETTIPKITLRTIVAFTSLILAMWYCFGEVILGYQNNFSLNSKTGMLGWMFSVPPVTMCVFIVSIGGWVLGNFHHRHVTNILFLEPIVGQYFGTYIIQIDNFPPLWSIVGSVLTLVGMYIVRESYERELPTPMIHQDYQEDLEICNKKISQLSKLMRKPSM